MGCILTMALCAAGAMAEGDDYAFDGSISRATLENYLSRAVTFVGLDPPHRSRRLPSNARQPLPSHAA